MYISLRENVELHWWGNSILLITNQSNFYVCEEEETFFIKHLLSTRNISDLVRTISREIGENQLTIKNFIEIFMDNFSEFFSYRSKENNFPVRITGKQNAFYPLKLHVSLTNTCVQKCKHCYKCATETGVFIDSKQLMSFLDSMSDFVPHLILSGGDPLLHPKFSQIVKRYANSYKIFVLSSGFNVNSSFFETLLFAKCGMEVSIYSSDPIIHDEFIGLEGSFHSIMCTVDNAIKYGVPIGVTTILRKDNFDDIAQLVSMLTELGVQSIAIGRMTPIGRAKANGIIDDVTVTNDLIEKIQLLKGTYGNVSALDIEGSSADGVSSRLSPFNCAAGTLSWAIFEDGEIQPCGVCRFGELSMGKIDDFDTSILFDRKRYHDKISKLDCIQALKSGRSCPFYTNT